MKMKTLGAVLLLLWSELVVVAAESGHTNLQDEAADTAFTQQSCQPDIHTVLREMSALVAEQRVELRHTKTQVEALEKKAETMETRMRASENKVETMETRMRDSESLVEQLKSENAAHAMNLSLTVSEVAALKREREQRRVSFSASLLTSGDGHTGPFSAATPLVYRHVFTNVGDGYNPNTGIFTAPVRGVYHFVVFLHGAGSSTPTGLSLHKNGEHVAVAYSHQTSGSITPSNGASLLLEVGDVVYVKLWPNSWVFDSQNRHTTFSGHLLFPM
ncbi:multimerin-2-like [Alosa sapidissima]|uniref:multimerin-2-like n=1 Tax=Alosa sapidissima TaxID=34773 RepID=UPI001C098262|nr:multimerin-2-like [Alosa sapidissima]